MIVCDDNQDDFGPKQEPALPTANTVKTLQRCWKNEGEWTGKVEISSRNKSQAVGETCMRVL